MFRPSHAAVSMRYLVSHIWYLEPSAWYGVRTTYPPGVVPRTLHPVPPQVNLGQNLIPNRPPTDTNRKSTDPFRDVDCSRLMNLGVWGPQATTHGGGGEGRGWWVGARLPTPTDIAPVRGCDPFPALGCPSPWVWVLDLVLGQNPVDWTPVGVRIPPERRLAGPEPPDGFPPAG